MKNKKIILLVALLLILCFQTIPITANNIKSELKKPQFSNYYDENDAEIPVWEEGHTWTYEVIMYGGIPNVVNLNNIIMTDLTITVEEVQNNSYIVSCSSPISGSATVDLDIIKISGTLQETYINGIITVNKTKMTIIDAKNLIISGYIKPNFLPKIPFTIDGDAVFTYAGNTLFNFPINNYESWMVHETAIDFEFDVNLLPDPISGYLLVESHIAECQEWDIVNVPAGEFDALKINTDLGYEHNVWYSVATGNVVKMRGIDIPFNWGDAGKYYIDIKLKYTNYHIESNPPTTPTELSGPTEVVAGYPEFYSAGGSTDPDEDMIRYIFDWGDGKKTGTDFVESGQIVIIDYYWTSKGTYNIKVKTRDKYGAESDWSEPITVTVTNDPPEKPEPPNGPMHGYWRETHTYTANTTDPDNHKIRYEFSWGDGKTSYTNLVESGEVASASHRWGWPKSYIIKVKAIDEFGEESPWSDPIEVNIPRYKTRTTLNLIFERFSRIFLLIESILK